MSLFGGSTDVVYGGLSGMSYTPQTSFSSAPVSAPSVLNMNVGNAVDAFFKSFDGQSLTNLVKNPVSPEAQVAAQASSVTAPTFNYDIPGIEGIISGDDFTDISNLT